MAVNLPTLVPIDFTSLDFDSIIQLVDTLIKQHPDYFNNVDDFQQSNAGRMTVELVAYIVDLLAERIDWIANELTLPTATQKQNLMNLMKLINYRLSLPTTAAVTLTATISNWVNPFVISGRYRVPAKDLNGDTIFFELLNKDDSGKYVYEGVGSGYEFDTGVEVAPILTQNNLVFYEGTSYSEFFTMTGVNNEFVQLGKVGIEEGSIRAWKVTRNSGGEIITKRELTNVSSFISPEAQTASASGLPPFKIQNTEANGAYLVFGEASVVAVFNQMGNDEIMVWYRTTSGSSGNITANAINYTTSILVSGQNVQVSFLNSTAASGGTESETIEHAKRYGPLTLTTVEKTVNPQDFVILLQDLKTLLNAVAYGKSNEPSAIYDDYGYYIPPYDVWIYPVYDKSGWENFPTYCYPVEMRVGRPYTTYGYLDSEQISFSSSAETQVLTKLKFYAHNVPAAAPQPSIKVTDYYNTTTYTSGVDYVIDSDARTITRIGGAIEDNALVIVQYYENSDVGAEPPATSNVRISFASGNSQPISASPIYPGLRTNAISVDLSTSMTENNVSEGDYNWPTNDYYIDYSNNTIVANPTKPFLDSKLSFGTSKTIMNGINNWFILNLDGLNVASYNVDHDVIIDSFRGWASIGNGLPILYTPGNSYSFKMSVNGGPLTEYGFTASGISGTWLTRELAWEIWDNAVDIANPLNTFQDSGAMIFADAYRYPFSPILTFMSYASGINSTIYLAPGSNTGGYTDLFSLPPGSLAYPAMYQSASGELVDVGEVAIRLRAAFNSMGLCNGFVGQSLAGGNEEKPEIYSTSNLLNPLAFTVIGSANNLQFNLTGTTGLAYDGSTTVTLTTVQTNSAIRPYDLSTYQGRLDLINDLREDIKAAYGGVDHIVEPFWLRIDSGEFYRIGFRLEDVGSTTVTPSIKMEEPSTNSARLLFQLAENQSSNDSNLLEASISPESDLAGPTGTYLVRISLIGALGPTAYLQVKANTALHNNTLTLLGMSNNQYKRGSSITQRTLIGHNNLIEVSPNTFMYQVFDAGGGPAQNDRFNLTITSAPTTPVTYPDGDYVITVPAGTYNIYELIDAINTAFQTSDMNGTPYDISTFLVCEKVEAFPRIRFKMIDFNSSASLAPDVEINDNDDATINKKAIDLLGFAVAQKMSTASTILLHYAGNWISDFESDTSEATSIVKYLQNNRLISQDYIVKDTVYTSFDVKGSVYVSKGFDRDLVKSEAAANVRSAFSIDKREFQSPVAITNITDIIGQVEGVDYLDIEYLGKDYQLYKKYTDESKTATATGIRPAEVVLARWSPAAAFKLTIDGCTVGGTNYDGDYLIAVPNSWTDRDYDSLVDAIANGGAGVGGLKHATPIRIGGIETDLTPAVSVRHNSGVITFETTNEGTSVSMKIDSPTEVLTYGYDSLSRTTDILESEYTPSTTYSIKIAVNNPASLVLYSITSPATGVWKLSTIASQINATAVHTLALVGMDESGKIRITSLLSGFASSVAVGAGTSGIDLLTLVGPADTPVSGSSGWVNCLMPTVGRSGSLVGMLSDGALYVEPGLYQGKTDEPSSSYPEAYNYKTKISSSYDEILFVSDDYFLSGATDVGSQRHGLILEFIETGKEA